MSIPCNSFCAPDNSRECSTHSLDTFTDAHKGHVAQQAQSVMEQASEGVIAAGSQSIRSQLTIGNTSRR